MAFLFMNSLHAQQSSVGSWHVMNLKYDFNEKWSAFFESQLRSQKVFNNYYYTELKGGVAYNAAPKTSLLFGFGQYATYDPGGNFKTPMQSHEFRLWEQLTLINDIAKFRIEHRYRIEQRFIGGNYRNRFRYRLSGTLPLHKDGLKNRTFYLNAYDEIFLTNTQPYFERNRAFGGVGYVFSDLFTWQLGYLHQFDNSRSHITSHKGFIQSSLLFELNKPIAGKRKNIGTID